MTDDWCLRAELKQVRAELSDVQQYLRQDQAALEQVKTERDLLLKTRDLMEAEINRLNGVIVDLNDEHSTETAELGSMYLKTDREYQKTIETLRAELAEMTNSRDMYLELYKKLCFPLNHGNGVAEVKS